MGKKEQRKDTRKVMNEGRQTKKQDKEMHKMNAHRGRQSACSYSDTIDFTKSSNRTLSTFSKTAHCTDK
jgi:hypothetical protein